MKSLDSFSRQSNARADQLPTPYHFWHRKLLLYTASLLLGAILFTRADTLPPVITAVGISNTAITFSFSNLVPCKTYRLEQRHDFGTNPLFPWVPSGLFTADQPQTNWLHLAGAFEDQVFFRLRVSYPITTNASYPTLCAEEDNINIPLVGCVSSFTIQASHPAYAVTTNYCGADFTNCPSGDPGYSFTGLTNKLFDDGLTVVEAVRENQWWRPSGMLASVDSGSPLTNIHYIRIYRKIADANEWPQFFVLYMDGNLRLIPHPPLGLPDVCFGSSVIVGPADIAQRPIAEISAVRFDSTSNLVEVTYAAGGSAAIELIGVNRTNALVRVSVGYPGNRPFATFRSMFVQNGNADVDHVSCVDANGVIDAGTPVLSFAGGEASSCFFYRSAPSAHNTTAPDIFIRIDQP